MKAEGEDEQKYRKINQEEGARKHKDLQNV
jgi:hypothetical protein